VPNSHADGAALVVMLDGVAQEIGNDQFRQQRVHFQFTRAFLMLGEMHSALFHKFGQQCSLIDEERLPIHWCRIEFLVADTGGQQHVLCGPAHAFTRSVEHFDHVGSHLAQLRHLDQLN